MDRNEDHGGQEAAEEAFDQAEEERAQTDEGEARQQKLIEILYRPPVWEQHAEQHVDCEDNGGKARQGARNGPEL